MKNLLFLSLMLVSTLTWAQHQKGDWNVSLMASPYPTETNNEDDFGAIGLVGMEFFVSSRVAFSGSFFTSDNTLISNNSGVNIQAYGLIPSVHYYLVNKPKWDVFGHAGYGFGWDDDKRFGNNANALRIYSVGPGGHYRFHEQMSLKVFLPYFNARNKTIEVNAASGIAVFLGVEFNL